MDRRGPVLRRSPIVADVPFLSPIHTAQFVRRWAGRLPKDRLNWLWAATGGESSAERRSQAFPRAGEPARRLPDLGAFIGSRLGELSRTADFGTADPLKDMVLAPAPAAG